MQPHLPLLLCLGERGGIGPVSQHEHHVAQEGAGCIPAGTRVLVQRHLPWLQIILISQCGTQITPLSSEQYQRSQDRKTFADLMGYQSWRRGGPEALPAVLAALSCSGQMQAMQMMLLVVQCLMHLPEHVTSGTAGRLDGDRACRMLASNTAAQPDLPCSRRMHASAKGSEHSVATSPRLHRRVTSCCRQSLWRSGTVMNCRAR